MSNRLALTYVEVDAPAFPKTTIMLHMDNPHSPPDSPPLIPDTNTTGYSHTWTAFGNAKLDPGAIKFGNASALFDGSGDYISTPAAPEFEIGTQDLTIDFWLGVTLTGSNIYGLLGQRNTTVDDFRWRLNADGTVSLRIIIANVDLVTFTSSNPVITNTWTHVALTRKSMVWYWFIDGVLSGTSPSSETIPLMAGDFELGRNQANPDFNGRIDEFRLYIGTARWISTFPVEQAPDLGALVTARFAIDNDYLPKNIDTIPSIIDTKLTPSIVSLGEDLGQRASLTIRFRDHKHIFDTDSFDVGTFWGKVRARQGPRLQGAPLRYIQGFVGQDITAMETRYFVVENMQGPDPTGTVQLIAKDLFKLADGDRAQAPVPSTGFLSANITNVATTATLLPSGIGNAEYPASGFLNFGGKEIVSFTRSADVLTITRAQFNTVAQAHNSQTRIQLCLRYNAVAPADIVYDLMVTYAGITSSYIPLSTWQSEVTTFLGAQVYSALIAEPTSVNKLISELIEQVGLLIWWDDLAQRFRLQVLRPISTDAAIFDEDVIMDNTLKVTEQPAKRLSQVYVYFDKINPLINDDQLENYRSTAFDHDTVAEQDYGSIAIKKIYSRWIPTGGRNVADSIINILLSRFRDPPRRFNFNVFRDESGNKPQLGTGYQLMGWPFQDTDGSPIQIPIQITSINPKQELFEVEAEEMLFTEIVSGSPGDHFIIFDASINNVNLESVHNSLYPVAVSGNTVNVTINAGVILGSTDTSIPALTIGSFAAGVMVNVTVLGRIQGKGGPGGNGAYSGAATVGGVGGVALYTRQAINLTDTSGQLWGGGGGGGGGGANFSGGTFGSGGGGGGGAGLGLHGTASGPYGSDGTDGTTEVGGNGGGTALSPFGNGGNGGGPGLSGSTGTNGNFGSFNAAGGVAGKAVDGISFVTTIGSPGDRRGGTIN